MYFFLISTFVNLCLLCESTSKSLECKTSSEVQVSCNATLYSDCNVTALKAVHDGLYEQKLFPGRPADLVLTPLQEVYPGYTKSGYYPGFNVTIKPPRTGDFQMVQGFQLNYHQISSNLTKRCIVLKLDNRTLQTNNISFQFKIYPLPQGVQDYNFTSFSLPTPISDDDKELQIRYGATTEKWVENTSPTSRWKTTISYYPNEKMKFIKVWFVKAPDSINILSYNVTLSKVIANDATSEEIRILVNSSVVTKAAEYEFRNLVHGKYRVGIQALDDKAGLPDCKCKNQYSVCSMCLKTITGIIVMPDDGTTTSTTSSTPQTASPTPGITNTTLLPSGSSADRQDAISTKSVLPSVLGVFAFFLVTLVVVGCFIINRNRIRRMLDRRPDQRENHFKTNLALTMSDGNFFPKPNFDTDTVGKFPKKKVAVMFAEENDSHNKVVASFASFLQTHCQCDVEYFPWAAGRDKFRWIAQTVDQADFHIFIASESALNQYNSWKRNTLPFYKDLFIPYLSKLLNRFDTKVNYAFVRFEYASQVLMPEELTNNQFMLMEDLTPLLACIHGLNQFKDDIQARGLPSVYDVSKTSAGRDLISIKNHAVKEYKSMQSRMDSGYTSRNEYSSIDEIQWREVQQKYILNELVKPQSHSPVNIQGAFMLDEDSKSLMRASRVTENISIAPAITIAEGGEEQTWQQGLSIDALIEQNQHVCNQVGFYIPELQPEGCKNHKQKEAYDQNDTHVHEADNRPDDSYFTPPDDYYSEEDISSANQLQMIDNINCAALRREDPYSDDAVSGYSV